MDVKEIECEILDRIQIVQYRVQWWALVNSGSTKGGKFLDPLSDSLLLKTILFYGIS
jgi:hypothetical protein